MKTANMSQSRRQHAFRDRHRARWTFWSWAAGSTARACCAISRCARPAAGPLRIALAERRHFSSGTSGRNSQLIHGGLRYLKNFEFKLVSEALAERAILLRTAPHLVEPLAFLIPMRDLFSALFYGAGLFLYDFLAGEQSNSAASRRSAPNNCMKSSRVSPGSLRARVFSIAACIPPGWFC